MRTVTYGAACSLDHFIARPDHAVDWLTWSDEVGALAAAYWETIDAVVMGRKTYEVARSAYPGVRNYVCSRTLREVPDPAIAIVPGDAAAFVRDLKEAEGRGICILGGGELANALFEADLIDEVGVNVHPVLLGAGIPLFHGMRRQIDLALRESRVLPRGCVYALYRVKR
jgi:dihydrofolate reductase